MVLNIETFTNPGAKGWRPGNNFGGSTLFKALGHPLAGDKAKALRARLAARAPVAVYDPLNQAGCFDAFYDLAGVGIEAVYVQKVEERGEQRLGHTARLVTEIVRIKARVILVAGFDAPRLLSHMRHLVPEGVEIVTFDDLRLPDDMLTNPRAYLDPLNFATNFGFLREGGGHHTVISSANYWSGYGAKSPELWLCLFGADGHVLARWREKLPDAGGTFRIDSREVKARFGLGDFAGSLFIHVVRAAGHDVVKYALDIISDDGRTLSCTHDANAWPADLYAGMPAPENGERVILWLQNSHPAEIPKGAVGLNIVGSQDVAWIGQPVPPFGTLPVDVAAFLPHARWPDQIEIQAGRYFVRPRYEVIHEDGRRRIAHANVERTDLSPDPNIPKLADVLGKGYVMPLPVLPLDQFESEAVATPMSTCQHELPLAVALMDAGGREVARRYLGRIARRESRPVDARALLDEAGAELPSGYGHLEFLYDFRNGGEADGWLHAFGRYRQKASRHMAETIFGAHIYNTPIVYKDEPQSYVAKPPGLSTRIFLRLGDPPLDTLCHLIYPASLPWHPSSATVLSLCDRSGREVASREVKIACGGSLFFRYNDMFEPAEREAAGKGGYVLVKDSTCRLFGFHGLLADERAFSLDHMFGF
ncbi:MAG: hypothetical protein WCF16_08125 [Alphaproteobacteria bacterium]